MFKSVVNCAALVRCLYIGDKNHTMQKSVAYCPQLVQAAVLRVKCRIVLRDLILIFVIFLSKIDNKSHGTRLHFAWES